MALSICHLHIISDLKFVVALRGTASSETPHRLSDQGKRNVAVNHVDGQMVGVFLLVHYLGCHSLVCDC